MSHVAKKFFTLSFSLVCFVTSSISAASPSSLDQEPERIVVYGERTHSHLKKKVRGQLKSFYRLFNQLNDERKYTVVCTPQKRRYSNLTDSVCEPRYIRQIRADLIKRAGFTATDFRFEIENLAKKEREAAKEHMKKLILSNAELREEFLKLNSLKLALQDLKASRG